MTIMSIINIMRPTGIGYYNKLNCGYQFVIILFYCVSKVYLLSSSADYGNYHPNGQQISATGGYQGSSSSWNYAYHFNWQSNDHNNLGKTVSRFAETSDSKQYIDPPLLPNPPPSHGINSRNYRHTDQTHRIKKNHHVNHYNNKGNYPGTGDSSTFIENIRNEIMSSFKDTLPGHFNHHHDYRPLDHLHPQNHNFHHQRDNMFDHYGHPNIHDNLLSRNFHLPSPHEDSSPTSTLKRYQRSHKQYQPEPEGMSKSSSWNFNSNQGFYHRVYDVDGKKHEEKGSYGDGQRSSGPTPSWINNYHFNHHQPNNPHHPNQLGQEINSIQGFPYNSDNFIFPPNHHHQHHHYPLPHHHQPNQNQPFWFQSTSNRNNQDYQRQKVNHGNN